MRDGEDQVPQSKGGAAPSGAAADRPTGAPAATPRRARRVSMPALQPVAPDQQPKENSSSPDGRRVIAFSLPQTLPTLNDLIRMNYHARKRLLAAVAWDVKLEILRQRMVIAGPIEECEIVVHRYSARKPDPDGFSSTAKILLDALQPVSKRHPFGLGLIREDSDKCIRKLQVLHVPKRQQRTDVTITVLREYAG